MKFYQKLSFFLLLLIFPLFTNAGDCLNDPIYDRDWNAIVTTGARVRSIPCMEGSEVLTVLPVGEVVHVIAETDGWYKIERSDGIEGWVGQWLIESTDSTFNKIESLPDLNNYRYETAVRYLHEKKIIQGYSDNTFRAENAINRAEFTKILVEAIEPNFVARSDYSKNCFEDIESDSWYAGYVCFAKKENIINGYPDGSFYPAKNINLAEALKIIVNIFELEKGDEGENWYDVYVNAMGDKSYIPSTFKKSSQEVTRGEMAEMMWRVMEQKNTQDSVSAEDLLVVKNSQGDCQTLCENIPSGIDMERVRIQWLAWYNEERAKMGKYAYVRNPQLARSAVAWSEAMKAKGTMDHKRFSDSV